MSAAEIVAMRSEQDGTMPDTGVVWRFTSASDGMGGNVETWAAAGTAACRLGRVGDTGEERVIADRLTSADPWVLTFPVTTTIYERDRVVVGTRTFQIEMVAEHGEWETARQCYGYEVGG